MPRARDRALAPLRERRGGSRAGRYPVTTTPMRVEATFRDRARYFAAGPALRRTRGRTVGVPVSSS